MLIKLKIKLTSAHCLMLLFWPLARTWHHSLHGWSMIYAMRKTICPFPVPSSKDLAVNASTAMIVAQAPVDHETCECSSKRSGAATERLSQWQ